MQGETFTALDLVNTSSMIAKWCVRLTFIPTDWRVLRALRAAAFAPSRFLPAACCQRSGVKGESELDFIHPMLKQT